MVFSFHPGRDDKEAQTAEVTFSPAQEGARVVLTHSGWEKLGAKAQKARDATRDGRPCSSPPTANTYRTENQFQEER